MKEDALQELERQVGVTFTDAELLEIAFTHPSIHGRSGREGVESYRRLEFLGDAVIRLVVSEQAYKNSHGAVKVLHNSREKLVPNKVLGMAAEKLNLRKYLRGSGSEDVLTSQKVLAKTYESLTGAIFLEKGYDSVADFVVRTLVRNT